MVRSAFARILLVCVLAGGVATPALAQHVVTDNEAGKLTLDALTATPAPVFHRAVYRPTHYAYARVAYGRHAMVGYRQAAVRTVAWHPTAHAAAVRFAAHRKTRRG
jgi:hypothetical protein